MTRLTIGGHEVRIRSWPQDGRWRAHAVRQDTGDRHGPDIRGDTRDQAIAATIAWLEWQTAHAAAFEGLREAERTYHRCIADAAFCSDGNAAASQQARQEALDRVVRAREQLDAIRERQPRRGE